MRQNRVFQQNFLFIPPVLCRLMCPQRCVFSKLWRPAVLNLNHHLPGEPCSTTGGRGGAVEPEHTSPRKMWKWRSYKCFWKRRFQRGEAHYWTVSPTWKESPSTARVTMSRLVVTSSLFWHYWGLHGGWGADARLHVAKAKTRRLSRRFGHRDNPHLEFMYIHLYHDKAVILSDYQVQ